jgi:hypothetical protein
MPYRGTMQNIDTVVNVNNIDNSRE